MKGFITLPNGNCVAIKAIDYTKISYSKTQKLLQKAKLSEKDVEYLKDVLFMLLFDTQTSAEKGFLVEVLDHQATGYKPKDYFLINNIKERLIEETGKHPTEQELINNPIAINYLKTQNKYERI